MNKNIIENTKIEFYEKSRHEAEIAKELMYDIEGSELCWIKWIFTKDNCSYWEIRIVLTIKWNVIWFILWDSDCNANKWYIDNLYICRKYRKKWLWKILLEFVENYYRKLNMDHIQLSCYEINPALDFYNKNWYKKIWENIKWWLINKKRIKTIILYKKL